ncbi:MAG: OmpA family protein [Candidatus Margulisbacteria bacterium]|nr:OmpA family protein [Candidatus Margulisiibacteriota bacterium]
MLKLRRKKVQGGEGGNFFTIWADFNSFLMILFLLLYTFIMNNVSESEQQQIFESIRVSLKGQYLQPQIAEKTPSEERINVVDKVKQYIQEQKLSDFLNVMVEESKIRVVLASPILYETGKATLKEDALEILKDIGEILKKTDNKIVIEGHTDNVPIKTEKYDSNWDLSFDRAYSVIKFFVEKVGISPMRIQAVGYGEYRPMMPNDTEENKAKNRRIEINIMLQEVFVNNVLGS